MGSLLRTLIPYGLAAAAAAPAAAVVAAIVLGQASRPIRAALLFVAGALALDMVVAVGILWIMEASGKFNGTSDISAWIDAILGALFLLLGIMAVFQKEDEEKAAARRSKIESLARSGAGKLVLIGLVVQIINSDSLAIMATGMKAIATGDVSGGDQAIAVAWLLILMLLPYYLPVVMYAVAPKRAAVMLRSFSGWLLDNSRVVEIVTGIVLGGLFLWKGLAAL